MNIIFTWIDQLIHSLPPRFLMSVRLGAVGLWITLAVYASIHAWGKGKTEAEARLAGKNTVIPEIEKKRSREKNLLTAPDIVLPDLDDLPEEESFVEESLSSPLYLKEPTSELQKGNGLPYLPSPADATTTPAIERSSLLPLPEK